MLRAGPEGEPGPRGGGGEVSAHGTNGGGAVLGPPSSPCSGTFEVFHKGGPRRKAKGPGLTGPRLPRPPSAAAPTQAAPAGALEEPRSPPFALRPSPSEGVLGTRAVGSRLRLAEEQALRDGPGTSAVRSLSRLRASWGANWGAVTTQRPRAVHRGVHTLPWNSDRPHPTCPVPHRWCRAGRAV